MKSLTIWTMVISSLICTMYMIKINLMIETDAEFYRASVTYAISIVAIWCAYTYVRDYEMVRAQEAHKKEMQRRFVESLQSMSDGPNKSE